MIKGMRIVVPTNVQTKDNAAILARIITNSFRRECNGVDDIHILIYTGKKMKRRNRNKDIHRKIVKEYPELNSQ